MDTSSNYKTLVLGQAYSRAQLQAHLDNYLSVTGDPKPLYGWLGADIPSVRANMNWVLAQVAQLYDANLVAQVALLQARSHPPAAVGLNHIRINGRMRDWAAVSLDEVVTVWRKHVAGSGDIRNIPAAVRMIVSNCVACGDMTDTRLLPMRVPKTPPARDTFGWLSMTQLEALSPHLPPGHTYGQGMPMHKNMWAGVASVCNNCAHCAHCKKPQPGMLENIVEMYQRFLKTRVCAPCAEDWPVSAQPIKPTRAQLMRLSKLRLLG